MTYQRLPTNAVCIDFEEFGSPDGFQETCKSNNHKYKGNNYYPVSVPLTTTSKPDMNILERMVKDLRGSPHKVVVKGSQAVLYRKNWKGMSK